jgi:hypothetical protein
MLDMALQTSTGDMIDGEPGDRELAEAGHRDVERSQVLTSWLVLVVLALVVIVGLVLLAVRGAG